MEGRIVEYIDGQRIITAICLEEKKNKVRLLNINNREIVLSKSRICLISKECLPLNQPREVLLEKLRAEIAKRESLAKEIDVLALWELLVSEGGTYTPRELAEFYFPETTSSAQESAIFRALFADRLHFKLRGNVFEVQSQERVEEILTQRAKEAEKKRKVEEAASWFKAVWQGEKVESPAQAEEYIKVIKEWCFWRDEAPQAKLAREILEKAGLNTEDQPFLLLVKLGVFSKHENILLHRFHIPTQFSDEVKAAAQILINSPPFFTEKRKDLQDVYTFTIDGPETRDYDDALSLEKDGQHYIVGIHITDLSPFIRQGSPLDEEAKERGTTIYLPDQKITMLPEGISEHLASLKKGGPKPSLSFLVTLNEQADIIRYEIVPGIIKIDRHFIYDEVNNLLTENETLNILYQLALKFREKRLKQGGLVIALPELVFSFSADQVVDIKQRNPEQPARVLVAEFMIMANYLAASFMYEKGIPALYRAQLPPRERIMNGTSQDLFVLYLQRKLLNRSVLDTKPGFHHILGLDKYTSITSPLRRYLDMTMQRQLIHYLQRGEPLYAETELSFLIPHFEEIIHRTGVVCSRRIKYWILTYLKQHVKEHIDAYVLEETTRGYRLLLPDYLIETELAGAKGKFQQGDKIRVRLDVVNPTKEILKVVLA